MYVKRCTTAPAVAVHVWVRVGSADEQEHEAGLAHIHEHMLFKGTERRGVGQIAQEIEGAGGEINAYTSFDQTVYHCVLSSRYFSVGLDVLADAVLHSTFDDDELERELEVIVEEIGRLEDSAGRITVQELFRTAYKAHPYRSPVIGTIESVRSMNRDKILAFFRRWYTGANLVVVVTGDMDEFQAAEQVAASFEGVQQGTGRFERTVEPTQEKMRFSQVKSHFQESHLNLAFHIPRCTHPDTPVLDLMALILGQGDSSRLIRSIKRRDRLVNDILCYAYTPRDPGLLTLSASLPEHAVVDEIVRASLMETYRLRVELCSPDELEKARHIIDSQQVYGRETVQGVARRLGYYATVAGSYEEEAIYFERIRNTSREDILRVAREYLQPDNLSVVHLARANESEDLTCDRIGSTSEEAFRSIHSRADRDLEQSDEAGKDAELHGAHLGHAGQGERGTLQEFSIPGGPHLLILRDTTLPMVAVRAMARGGIAYERPDKIGCGRLMSSVLTLGTAQRDANDVAVAVESLAGYLDAFSGRDVTGIRCGFLSQHLDKGWELFAETIREPAFSGGELERERSLQLEDIRCQSDRPASLTIREMTKLLYPDHPYGLPVLGDEDTIRSMTREDVVTYYERILHPSRLVVSIVGDVNVEKIINSMESLLPERDRYDQVIPTFTGELPPVTGPKESIIQGEGAQAHVVIGFRGIPYADSRRPILDVLLTVLSGQGGRLFLELRDRKSLAYSVNASSFEGKDTGFLYAYMGTSPEKVSEAKRGLETALLKLVNERVSETELERSKRYIVGVHDIGLQRYAMRAAHYGINAIYGVDRARFEAYTQEVEGVTREDLQSLAGQLIDLNKASIVIFEPV
jgi:zinc protease